MEVFVMLMRVLGSIWTFLVNIAEALVAGLLAARMPEHAAMMFAALVLGLALYISSKRNR
jgi:hypothetical protein